jgi:hypothetical protein
MQRRYTHSVLWRCTIERLRAGHPSLVLGWQRWDRHVRWINLVGVATGILLILTGMI